MGDGIVQQQQDDEQSQQQGLPAGLTPGGVPPQAATPTAPNVNVDEDKDVDVDQISAQFLKHWLQRTPPAPGEEAAPGSFASKLSGAVGQLGRSLGDANAATATPLTPGMSGALAGVTRTLEARGKRERQEKEDAQKDYAFKQQSAVNTLNIAKMSDTLRNAGVERQNAHAKLGREFADDMKERQHNVVYGLSDDKMRAERKGYNDPQGRSYDDVFMLRVMDYDENRKPIWARIDKEGRKVDVSAKDSAELKEINQDVPEHTQLDADTFNTYKIAVAKKREMETQLDIQRGKALQQKQSNLLMELVMSPYVQKGMAGGDGDAVQGLQDETKEIDNQLLQLNTLMKELDSPAHEDYLKGFTQDAKDDAKKKVQSHIAELEKGKQDIQTYTALKITNDKELLDNHRKTTEEQDKNKVAEEKVQVARDTASIKAAANTTNQAAINEAGESLVEGRGSVPELPRRGTAGGWLNVIAAADAYSMKQYGVHFDWAQQSLDWAYAKNARTNDVLGNIRSLAGHDGSYSLDVTENAAKKLPQYNLQLWNKIVSRGETQFGSQAITDFHTSLLDFADLYAKVMGGTGGSDTARQQALDLIQDAYSKNQLQGAFKILRADLDARARGIIGRNRYLHKQYGADFNLGVWDPKSASVRMPVMPNKVGDYAAGKSAVKAEYLPDQEAQIAAHDREAASAQQTQGAAPAAQNAPAPKGVPGSFQLPTPDDLKAQHPRVGIAPGKKTGEMWFYDSATREPLRKVKPGEVPEGKE